MKKRAFQILIFSLVVFDAILLYAMFRESRGEILAVAFLDVGQGDAIFIEAPNGVQVIIDGGPDNSLLHQVGKAMPFYDRTIDIIVVTNPDKDHFAGFIPLLARYKIREVVEPGTQTDTNIYHVLEKSIAAEGLKSRFLKTGDRIILDAENKVVLDVLFPDRDVSGLAENNGSLIARLSYGAVCFLFTGDTAQGVEEFLVHLYGDRLACQVLKVAHHGSKTSSALSFVEKVSPEYAVISSGKENTYGHPHQETLDTLNRYKAQILRTDTLSTITFKTDGRTFWQK
jgi:competence protein ComEC